MATAVELREEDAGLDPFALFRRWFAEAVSANLSHPEAMTLATATRDGLPGARIVLLRGFDEAGFVFFTNYQSRKGRELANNPRASLLLHWPDLGRQVRIEGAVEVVTTDESDAYFRTRPRGNQLAAWISPQSEVIADRQTLLGKMQQLAMQYPDEVPRPPFWGGYRVRPHSIEFWQTRENRLHDRLRYRQTPTGWVRERLAP
jgi:pyridoxamine 5'-phosphate oxidase